MGCSCCSPRTPAPCTRLRHLFAVLVLIVKASASSRSVAWGVRGKVRFHALVVIRFLFVLLRGLFVIICWHGFLGGVRLLFTLRSRLFVLGLW